MKNKKSIYVLAPAVLLIWAFIFYRVSDGLQSGNAYYPTSSASVTSLDRIAADTFTYTLALDYPDPFLGKRQARTPVAKAPSKAVAPQVQPTIPKPTPTVSSIDHSRYKFVGLVEHKDKKDQLVLVSIDGKSVMLRKGESADGVQLIKIFKDSVEVKHDKQRFFIKR